MRYEVITELARDPKWIAPFAAFMAYLLGRLWLRRTAKRTDGLARAIADFKACGMAVAVLIVCLLFSFSTPVVSSFGVPRSADQMSDPAELFRLLRMYNTELVAASAGVQWCAIFFGLTLASAIRVMREIETRLPADTTAVTSQAASPKEVGGGGQDGIEQADEPDNAQSTQR